MPTVPQCQCDACRSAGKPGGAFGDARGVSAQPLISGEQADRVAELFKCLAHPTRLRLIHALVRAGELGAGDLADAVGVTPQVASNQLKRLAELRVVDRRRDGLAGIYRVIDPCVPLLFGRAWCHVESFIESKGESRPPQATPRGVPSHAASASSPSPRPRR